MLIIKGMLFSGSSANPACCLCTRSHKPLGCMLGAMLWLPVQHRSSDYSKSSWWPLCPGWSDTGAVSVLANSAFSWYPKVHIGLLTLSYAVSAGPSAVEGKGIFFLSLFSDMALNMPGGRRFHWCVVMSQSSFTSLVDIDGCESLSLQEWATSMRWWIWEFWGCSQQNTWRPKSHCKPNHLRITSRNCS